MELRADIIAQFRPITPAETRKLEDMAQAWWLHRRARTLQTNAIEDGDDKALALYLRYETTQRRSYQMAYQDFKAMQSAREDHEKAPVMRPRITPGVFQSEPVYTQRDPGPAPAAAEPDPPVEQPNAA